VLLVVFVIKGVARFSRFAQSKQKTALRMLPQEGF
jgi:hypothetical protein